MSNFETVLKALRISSGMTQGDLAKQLKVSRSTIGMYESGQRNPDPNTLEAIADIFNVDVDYLLGRTSKTTVLPQTAARLSSLPPNIITPSAYPVPILGTICAGDGIVMEESYKGTFYVDKSIKADYCLFVKGDSMTGANIYDGDVAFLIKEYDFVDGEIYAVQFGTCGDASLKRVTRSTGKLILQPCNPDYQPVIEDPADVYIVGKLVGHYHEDQI